MIPYPFEIFLVLSAPTYKQNITSKAFTHLGYPPSLDANIILTLMNHACHYLNSVLYIDRIFIFLAFNNSIRFSVRYIYILQQSSNTKETSFHIAYQIPLGAVLEPIGLNRFDYISCELQEFFNKMNLYENEKSYEQKRDKFHRLSICLEEIFNTNTLHCFTYAFLPYGSFRLVSLFLNQQFFFMKIFQGLNGEDLDTVFVLSEQKSIDNKTDLDQNFLQLRYDSSELNNLILDLLEKQVHNVLNNEIIACRRIQAVYPIISILFHDQTRVEIFVQIKEKSIFNEGFLLSNIHEPIHGVRKLNYPNKQMLNKLFSLGSRY